MYPENKSQMRKTAGLPDTGSISDPSLRLFLDRIRQRFTEMENKLAYYESDAFIDSSLSALIGVRNNGTSATLFANAPADEEKVGVLGGSGGSVHWLETDEC